jgi:hypothetical protein
MNIPRILKNTAELSYSIEFFGEPPEAAGGNRGATAERGELVIQNKQELHKELQTGFYRSLRISIFAADCDFSGGLLALIFAEC